MDGGGGGGNNSNKMYRRRRGGVQKRRIEKSLGLLANVTRVSEARPPSSPASPRPRRVCFVGLNAWLLPSRPSWAFASDPLD